MRSNEHTEQDQRGHRCRPGSRTGLGPSAPERTPPVGIIFEQIGNPTKSVSPKKLPALVPRVELSFGEKLVPWIRWPISIAGGDRTSGGTNRRHLIDDRRVVRLTPRTSFILTRKWHSDRSSTHTPLRSPHPITHRGPESAHRPSGGDGDRREGWHFPQHQRRSGRFSIPR